MFHCKLGVSSRRWSFLWIDKLKQFRNCLAHFQVCWASVFGHSAQRLRSNNETAGECVSFLKWVEPWPYCKLRLGNFALKKKSLLYLSRSGPDNSFWVSVSHTFNSRSKQALNEPAWSCITLIFCLVKYSSKQIYELFLCRWTHIDMQNRDWS